MSSETELPHVGFIGLGNMGANMAACLRAAGYPLSVHDLARDRAATLVEQGALWCNSVAECARQSQILITSLPEPRHVESVMDGADGGLAHLPAGSVWVDMTTNDEALVKRLANIAQQRDISVMDAPVTGAVDGARRGELTIFVGGDQKTLERVRAPLEVMGAIIHCGELGTGNAVKLVTNYLWFTHAAVLGEGLLLGKQAGVSLDVLWDAIKRSVGDSFVARHDAPSIFAGHYDPSFTLALCLKDLRLCQALAERVGSPTPVGEVVADRFHQAAQAYGESAGELHVAKLLEDTAGTDLRLEGEFVPHWEV